MHRLFIDIPLQLSVENAVTVSKEIVDFLTNNSELFKTAGVEKINYRLGHDEDRQKSNYLLLDPNGHVSTKKCTIVVNSSDRDTND